MVNLNIGVIIITKNRLRMVRHLVDSIVKGGLDSFSLILIDDSNSHNFLQTRDFLKSYSIQSIHTSSLQAAAYVEKTLEETNLTADEKRFIRNCTGLQSPFDDYVESFFNQNDSKLRRIRLGLRFAPYSVARNLGIYYAVCFFNPDVILFLDDDCVLLNPKKLKAIVQMIEARINGRKIVALAGIYKEISVFKPKVVVFDGSTLRRALGILRGMDAFLRRSLAVQKERFNSMPPHMLGGALVLSRRVFHNLPFDPYIARGEDHAYAQDLRSLLGKNEIAVRDNQFIVGHVRAEFSKNHEELNALRDIFRFVYLHAKTAQWPIPLFIARWSLASIFQMFLNPSKYVQCKNQLLALIFYTPRFAKENACKFRLNLKAWTKFLSQSQTRIHSNSIENS